MRGGTSDVYRNLLHANHYNDFNPCKIKTSTNVSLNKLETIEVAIKSSDISKAFTVMSAYVYVAQTIETRRWLPSVKLKNQEEMWCHS